METRKLQLIDEYGSLSGAANGIVELIKTLPTIDPVHSAGGCYCRECERSKEVPNQRTGQIVYCRLFETGMDKSAFCSLGKPRRKKQMHEHNACYMCDNARINGELTDDNDLSFISIGSTDNDYRMMLGAGGGKPLRMLLEYLDGDRWNVIGYYKPSYCPNCGRKIVEYD